MPITVRSFERLVDAAGVLASDRASRFIAGGTLVMRDLHEGDVSISTLVRTKDRAFSDIATTGGRIEIGAGATMAQVLANRDLDFLHPVARHVGGPAIRQMATVGGNLFAPSPYGDFATALLALDATVTLASGFSPREVPLAEFLARRSRPGNGVVAKVSFARPAHNSFRFRKAARVRPRGASVIAIAAVLPQSGGRVTGARVAYGAMAETPIRVPNVERALENKTLDASGISTALGAAAAGLSPPTDPIASSWYRSEVAPVHLRRLLLGETG